MPQDCRNFAEVFSGVPCYNKDMEATRYQPAVSVIGSFNYFGKEVFSMKRIFKIGILSAMLTAALAFPAFAKGNEAKQAYRAAAAEINTEIKENRTEIKALTEANKAARTEFNTVRKARKEKQETSVNKEDFKTARELMKTAKPYQTELKAVNTELKTEKAAHKAARKEKNFETALSSLKKVQSLQEEKLEKLEKINSILKEVDALLR